MTLLPLMDRTWTEPCHLRDCGHAAEDHLATPELAGNSLERIVFCRECRRHETVRPERRLRWFAWPASN